MKGKFFETIKLLDGKLFLLPYHEKRMRATRLFFYGINDVIDLSEIIEVPENLQKGLYRCRVSYDKVIRNVEFFAYELKENEKILLLEIGKNYDYSFKFEDRVFFKNALQENPDVDDVLFLSNDYVTDCTYTNIVLYDGNRWVTPDTQLLTGVKRQYCIDNDVITVRKVKIQHLVDYQKIALINSMRDFELVYDFELHEDKLYLKRDKVYEWHS
ncbi:MAG: 4-amino-4-deoxychorismate lyase [Spirosomataceae bacterium]|jgi:4-amino-4-deoxychorismate lyase